ncbi:MAG: SapC family protein [Magnetococcales bacterium]|nr:SapC family protein [Magnetococcales bacterium]
MSQVIFYNRPEPVNKDLHRNLKLDVSRTDLSFAAKTNSVPLAGAEFQHAVREYPIVFLQGPDQSILATALLGVRNDENLFIGADGRWNATYVPAFVRRYPFILASNETQPDQMTVCLDGAWSGFNTEQGEPLFDENGAPSTLMNNTIRFLQECQNGYQQTEQFIKRLQEMDLLVTLTAQVETGNGQKFAIQGLMAVDEKKLLALDEANTLKLFRSGELGWIYAHLLSLGNINRLVQLLAARHPAGVRP